MYAGPATDYDTSTTDLSRNVFFIILFFRVVYGVIYAVATTDYDKTTPDLSCNGGLVFWRPNHLSPTTAGLGTPDQRQPLRRDYDKTTTKKGN